MPKKRTPPAAPPQPLTEAAQAPQAPGGFAQLVTQAPPEAPAAAEPVALRQAANTTSADRPAVAPFDALDPITTAMKPELGAYKNGTVRFSWAKAPNGYAHNFTRFYFVPGYGEKSVGAIVDIFAAPGSAVDKEVAHKSACITAENDARKERDLPPIGYLPIVRGAVVPFEAFDAVKHGAVLPLQHKRSALETVR